jgi:hypothetical protein
MSRVFFSGVWSGAAASAFPVIVVFPMSGFINSLLDLALNLVENASGIGEYDLRAIPT